tara:strand:- start:253 stop:498 length:246 start_codon:yes stop_codon:yes gene_type:complete
LTNLSGHVTISNNQEKGFVMSKMSDWAIDLEDATVEALNNGAECEADVIAYVKTKVAVVDEEYVSDLYTEFCGDWMSEAYA